MSKCINCGQEFQPPKNAIDKPKFCPQCAAKFAETVIDKTPEDKIQLAGSAKEIDLTALKKSVTSWIPHQNTLPKTNDSSQENNTEE